MTGARSTPWSCFILAQVSAQTMQKDAGMKKTQVSFRQGLCQHGRAAEAALVAEFDQLEHSLDVVYEPVNATLLTRSRQRRAALRAINLIKEKRCTRSAVRGEEDSFV